MAAKTMENVKLRQLSKKRRLFGFGFWILDFGFWFDFRSWFLVFVWSFRLPPAGCRFIFAYFDADVCFAAGFIKSPSKTLLGPAAIFRRLKSSVQRIFINDKNFIAVAEKSRIDARKPDIVNRNIRLICRPMLNSSSSVAVWLVWGFYF